MLARAAADPVLELDIVVHRLVCFCFFLIWKFLLLFFLFPSCCHLLFAASFGLDPDGPDEAQQFACNRRHGLSAILASSNQRHIALMQAVLRFPCNLGDFCRKSFLASA